MNQGLFITFEGPDGSGKTTQIKRVRQFLDEKGLKTLVTREPGGTVIGEKIRTIILDPLHSEMDPIAEAMLYAASRAQHTAQVILPAIAAGYAVICDRYMDSSIAYQGYGRKLGDSVRIINEIAVMGLIPDLTFLLMLDPEIGRRRICGELDRLELEKSAFLKDVYDGYLKLAEQNPERIMVIDANREMDAIESDIIEKISERIHQHIEVMR